MKADYAGLRAANRQTMVGLRRPHAGQRGVRQLACSPDERAREFEARLGAGRSAVPRRVRRPADRPGGQRAGVAEFVRDKIRDDRRRSRRAEAALPDDRHRLQTSVRRHRLLRHLQPTERDARRRERARRSTRSPSTASASATATYELDVDRVRHGLRRHDRRVARQIDIRGRGGETLRDAWAAGPRTYLGLDGGRLPEPVPRHRTGQPVGAHQHGDVDRAPRASGSATTIDHLRRNGLGRIEATRRGPGRLGRVREHGGRRSRSIPSCNSWYLGANVPGKPRVFMPLVGLPALRRAVRRDRRSGLRGLSPRLS